MTIIVYLKAVNKLAIFLISLLLANILIISNAFVNKIITAREFYVFFIMLALLVLTFRLKWIKYSKTTIELSLSDLLLLVYFFYIIGNTLFKCPYVFNTGFFINHVVVLILYFCCKWLLQNKIIRREFLFKLLFFMLFIELIWAYLQYLDVSKSYNSDFNITGSFENPGPLTTYLSILVPVCIMLLLSEKRRGLQILYLFSCMALSFLIAISNQRASWIGGIAGVIIVLLLHYRIIVLKWAKKPVLLYSLLTFALAAIILSSVLLYNHKLDSSKGRLFIWHNCIELIANKPVFGHGFENYLVVMNNKQANYFAQHPDDMDNALLASNIEFAFNDYLQMLVETGLVGFLLFMAFICISLKNALQRVNNAFQNASITSILVILIMALVTYPFHTLSIQIVFFLFLAVLNSFSEEKIRVHFVFPAKLYKPLYYFIIALILIASIVQVKRIRAQKQWKVLAYEIRETQDVYSVFAQYKELLSPLQYDRYFLYNYATELSVRGLYKESLSVFEKALVKINDSDTYLYMGHSYENIGQYEKAEACFIQSINLIPHRFYPRYRLVKLLNNQGRRNEAIQMAEFMINMPVKVESESVNSILIEMKQFCNTSDVQEGNNHSWLMQD